MNTIITAIIQFAVILFAVSIHEASHAWVAFKCGDPTAKDLGRCTINPIPHIDLFGTIILPLLMAILPGNVLFGYAKPVPVNPHNLRNYKRDNMLVSAAGPVSNILAGIGGILIFKVLQILGIISNDGIYRFYLYLSGESSNVDVIILVLFNFVLINFILTIFNLLPIPPLDGSGIIEYFLKGDALRSYNKLRPYGFLILIGMLYLGIFSWIARPVITIIIRVFLKI